MADRMPKQHAPFIVFVERMHPMPGLHGGRSFFAICTDGRDLSRIRPVGSSFRQSAQASPRASAFLIAATRRGGVGASSIS